MSYGEAAKSGEDREKSREAAAFWKEQIKLYEETHRHWEDRAEAISVRYRDERNKAMEQGQRRLNTLWANTEILRPAIYSQCPTPIIERRFLDRDPVGRMSAQMLERATRFQLEENGYHNAVKRAVKDYLLGGRGQAWVRYEPEFGQGISIPSAAETDLSDEEAPDEREEKLEDTGQQLLSESAPVDYVHWRDFYVFPAHARTWSEVTAVGKRVFMSKDECAERWGKELANEIQPDTELEQASRKITSAPSIMFGRNDRKRVVFEIWNKTTRKVYWLSTGYDCLIDEQDDPLELKGFFPCPAEPLLSVTTNDTIIPVPFFIEYQDQAILIDELTQRIHMLGKCIKAAGTYDASNRALKRLLDEATENELIPVDNWSQHREKGGVEGAISFLPIRDMVEALQVLVELRAKVIEDQDRITGIVDIMRGTQDARETLGGQRIKSNTANTRLDDMRESVAVFARDLVRLVAEVVAKHFKDKTIIQSSGILYEEEITLDDYESMHDLLEPPAAPPQPQPPGPAAPPMPGPGAPGALQGTPGQPGGGLPPPPPGAVPPSPMPMQPPHMPMPGSQMPMPVPAPMGPPPIIAKVQRIGKALKLLRDDAPRGYRITIETDSTVAGEIGQERSDSIQFISATTKYLEQAQLIGASNPAIIPLLGKLLQFAVRKFRTGRDVEGAIDDFIDKADRMAKHLADNPQPKPPTPEEVKAQTEREKGQMEIQKMERASQIDEQNDQRRAQQEMMQLQHDQGAQAAEEHRQTRLAEMKFQFETRTLQMREEMERRKTEMQMQAEAIRQQREREHEEHRMVLERQHREHEHAFNMREMEAKAKENDAARAHQAKQRKAGGGKEA
jgi:hypothetical protein